MASGRQQARDARKAAWDSFKHEVRVAPVVASEPKAPALKAPAPEGLMQKVRKKAKKVLKKKGK